jgi:DNA-directed RNA polymerase subunit RPC12/RpoP
METHYKGKLRCATCGSDSHFEFNEDKSYIKCSKCNREYLGGYDELMQFNQETIDEIKNEIVQNVKKEITQKLKDAFRGNKNIKFK